ncbi:MAG: glycosyltransferase [Candidatus Neomarinimicrobiota bacterium]|tara:strand:- start:1229 stop:2317 length:1089 start_codon:yes stop_codon:yes gene_type:complete
MKILYISPENTVGTLSLWREEHISRGNQCRAVTFFRSPKKFEDDICLDLSFNFTRPLMSKFRNIIYKSYRGRHGYFKEKDGYPPLWRPEGFFDSSFFKFKDWLWKSKIEKVIKEYNLFDYDVYHFESGMDFLKNEFFVQQLNQLGKKIICHYHGEDLRSRGVMPYIDKLSDLNLTNEVDLLSKHPNIEYIFLPFDTSSFNVKDSISDILKISHAPTNRFYKGSNQIIKVCEKLENQGKIKFDLIENLPHSQAMERKSKSDIFIDQLGNKGGWGYGMNSVESLSMGICTLTEMNDAYDSFIPDHPFVSIKEQTLESEIETLIMNRDKILEFGKKGRKWVQKHHDIKQVSNILYDYYKKIGLLD